jgi:hypothetical protein
MREMTKLAVIAAMGLAMLDARAQTSPQPQPQAPAQSAPLPQAPAQSAPPSATTGRAVPQAPTSHRQPRAADVPNEGARSISPGEMDIDDRLKICRDCQP